MTRYLLDTNIIGKVTRPNPSATLMAWMAEQVDTDLFISALTVGEIQRGLLENPRGKSARYWKHGSPDRKDRKPCSPAACSPSTRRRA